MDLKENIFCDAFDNIKIDQENILDVIDRKRKKLKTADKGYLVDKGITVDLDNIESIPNGRFRSTYRGVTFEMMFHEKRSQHLYVILNGARTSNYPEFKRWSWYPFIQGSMLNIADPMYAKFPNLKLGWYYGDSHLDYRGLVSEIIIKIANYLRIESKDIIIYGSSGGGAACIEVASLVGEGCTSIAINPQIYLRNFATFNEFALETSNSELEDNYHRIDSSYWIKQYPKNNFIFIENIASNEDRKDIVALSKEFGFQVEYGLTICKNIITWLYDARTFRPHDSQEDFYIHWFIVNLKNVFQIVDNEEINRQKRLYLLISEIWNKKWEMQLQIESEKKKVIGINSEFVEIFNQKDIYIKSNSDRFNALIFNFHFIQNTVYQIEISGLRVRNANRDVQKASLCIKDRIQNKLIFRKDIPCGQDTQKVTIITGEDVKNLELKIYAGLVSFTEGNELIIERVIIQKNN